MQNYLIEGDIDFYNELKNRTNSNDCNEDENTCLITGEELCYPTITLLCGHKFNYFPLLDEVKKQKRERRNIPKLSINQIKCPFCRNIQNKLLPYICFDISGYQPILGVNSPSKYCMFLNKCNYIYKSGKNKNMKCNNECNDEYCKKHFKLINSKKESQKTQCKYIFKRGINKGKQCCVNVKDGEYCGKHKNK